MTQGLLPSALRRAPFGIFAKKIGGAKAAPFYFASDVASDSFGVTTKALSYNKHALTSSFGGLVADEEQQQQRVLHPRSQEAFIDFRSPALDAKLQVVSTLSDFHDRRFLLGCFATIDTFAMKHTRFSAGRLLKESDALHHIDSTWYEFAFESLPMASFLLSGGGDVLYRNGAADGRSSGERACMRVWLEQIAEKFHGNQRENRYIGDAIMKKQRRFDVLHFSADYFLPNNLVERAWAWQPLEHSDDFAVAMRLRGRGVGA